MKPGYKTTEFYMSLLPTLLVLLQQVGIVPLSSSEQTQLVLNIGSIVTLVGYTLARSKAKGAVAQGHIEEGIEAVS